MSRPPLLARALLGAAHLFTPAAERPWVEAMRGDLEDAHAEGHALSWAFGCVVAAVRFRWAATLALSPRGRQAALRIGFVGTIVCSFAVLLASIGAGPSIDQFKTFGFRPGAYRITVNSANASEPFVTIAAAHARHDEFAQATWAFDPAPWRGKRIRISARLKTTGNVRNATLWALITSPTIMTFDGPTETTSDADAPHRQLHGNHDWTTTYVVLDVPLDATTMTAGTLLQGMHGAVFASLPQISLVLDDVATTATTLPATAGPVPTITPIDANRRVAIVDDLRKALKPITTTDPGALNADTQPILQAIGTARIAGLGEATHGTAEFFNLKDRLFRDLVRHHGVTVFALEASQPEAREMDRYVVTGAGDPRHALRSIGFWTWNTEEVLALVRWMREYNATRGTKPVLHFAGFDMQSAVVASRNVVAAIIQASPDAGRRATDALACVRQPAPALGAMSDAAWRSCRASVGAIAPLVSRYVSDVDVRHDFLVLKEFAADGPSLFKAGMDGTIVRDKAMADNVTWLAGVRYPGQKFVLWAHNAHIADRPTAASMGSILARRFGRAYYRLGFAFDGGTIRAYGGAGAVAVRVEEAPPDSFEGVLHSADASTFFLNLDHVPAPGLLAWLDSPLWHRQIGATYDKAQEAAYFDAYQLRDDFDGLIFVDRSHPSKGLRISS